MDIKSQASAGVNQTSNDILFLKRLLFLKASLDNETQFNSFAVPFEEEKAFKQQSMLTNERAGLMSAPAGDVKNNTRDLMAWEAETEEQPLAITNGETDGEQTNLALLPPSGLNTSVRGAPRTAAGNRGRNTTSMGN